jgi:ketosteroid isomerase-like protein
MSEVNQQTIQRLYDGLDRADGEAMAACYAPSATFSDPVFEDLEGSEVGDMWRMLCERSTDLSVELAEHTAGPDSGHAHWIATYTFRTGRKVVNDIQAEFRFTDDGRLATHRDTFDLWKWSRQALGPIGLALGWSPIVRNKIRTEAADGLAEFRSGRSGTA